MVELASRRCGGIIGDTAGLGVGKSSTHAIGAMSLGLYRAWMRSRLPLSYGEAKLVFAEDEEQVDKLLTLAERVPQFKHIVYSDPRGMQRYDDPP
jgi:long-chain acyl-CoA synthetase